MALPKAAGVWPATLLLLAFAGFLLADPAPDDPARLAYLIAGYWSVTFAGMIIFGPGWCNQAELGHVLFAAFAKLAPLRLQSDAGIGGPGWQVVSGKPVLGLGAFALMMLGVGSFDGLNETFWWLGQIGVNPLEFPGRSAVQGLNSAGLIGANIAVIAVYAGSLWVGIWAAKRWSGLTGVRFAEVFSTFAIAILPIALGYHFAHYFVSFLVQVQVLAATLADPFARGWSLFGLGDVRVTTGFLNSTETVRPILLTNVATVVISHILSVVMAHSLARFAQNRRSVILLQVGLSVLMIAYTVFGLWLLSTPRGA